jgi:N-acetylmuramoyl-L-alanine amidase
MKSRHRWWLRTLWFVLMVGGGLAGHAGAETPALRISNRYSPLNKKRPRRPETKYIILHTTEGSEQSSLHEVRRYGETHYFVTPSGGIYRIIDRDRIATHAGRSMWQGISTLDNHAVGIEVVGRYDRDITTAQYTALRELLQQLKSLYGVPDERILTHSMVAYGRPNRFHPHSHRGRKRCGMIFARPDVRERLGLLSKPAVDEDVAGGRLVVADPELQSFLYAAALPPAQPERLAQSASSERAASSPEPPPAVAEEPMVITKGVNAWSIARERYNRPDTTYLLPGGERLRGDEIRDWNKIPVGTQVMLSGVEKEEAFEGFLEVGKDGVSARELARDAYDGGSTIYFFPDGLIRTGAELRQHPSVRSLLENAPKGTRILVGYTYGGYVRTRRPPARIAGSKWNYPSTFYRLPDGRILSGDEIDDKAIPPRTLLFYQN